MSNLPVIQIITYAFTLWFGLYLMARSPGKVGLRFAGLGLLAYAVGIGLDALVALGVDVLRWRLPLLFLPPVFWLGATLYLLPDISTERRWQGALLAEAALTYIIGVVADFSSGRGAIYWALVAGSIGLLLAALAYVWSKRETLPRNASTAIMAVTVFFALGTGAMVLGPSGQPDWLSQRVPAELVYWGIGIDILLLSYILVVLDAYDAGEALLPDFVRSMGGAFIAALIFGGQIVLVMAITGRTQGSPLQGPLLALMLALLLATIATAIAFQTFADGIDRWLDRLLLARFPRLQAERASLRALSSALPRIEDSLDMTQMSEEQFVRITRRALGDMGDMQRLSASPLINLPLIDARASAAAHSGGHAPSTLERAAELRALLVESIARLKPRGDGDFGTTDEWRYYNALYYRYVAGLKPYNRRDIERVADNGLTPDAQAALDWLRTYVPERTLHNWQNAAARLVAQDLREQMQAVPGGRVAGVRPIQAGDSG